MYGSGSQIPALPSAMRDNKKFRYAHLFEPQTSYGSILSPVSPNSSRALSASSTFIDGEDIRTEPFAEDSLWTIPLNLHRQNATPSPHVTTRSFGIHIEPQFTTYNNVPSHPLTGSSLTDLEEIITDHENVVGVELACVQTAVRMNAQFIANVLHVCIKAVIHILRCLRQCLSNR